MKVLIIAPVPPPYGGMALQALQLERLLRADGVDAMLQPSNFPLPWRLSVFERVPGVRTALRSILMWPLLFARIRTVDVVHVLAASWLYFFVVVYPAVLLGRLLRRRVVINYRSGAAPDFFRRYGWLLGPAFHWANAITAPSEYLAKEIRDYFGVTVSIVPNILNTSLFAYRPRPNLRPSLLVTRHLEPLYDVESVLRAYRLVREVHPDASLTIAGDGCEEARLRSLAAEWGLPNVHFLGAVRHADLPAIYDRCDIYVNASRVDNFPGALIEASAAGLAIVTTRAGGIPFIYQHQRDALLVEPGDWETLGRAVLQILEMGEKALQMTANGLAIAATCRWSDVRNRLLESYGVRAARSHDPSVSALQRGV